MPTVAVAASCAAILLALLVLGGFGLAAAIRDGFLASLDVEIRRWQSGSRVPPAARAWVNRTAKMQCGQISGRQVVVVGNAPTVHELGVTIDAVEVVVRVNPAGERNMRHARHAQQHHGRVAHALHVNTNHPPSRVDAIFGRFSASQCVWSRSRAATALQLGVRFADKRVQEYDPDGMVAAYPELRACGQGKFLTAGMLAVLHALATGARRPVLLAGITAFVAVGHAVTNSSWRFHEQQLARYHCIDVERRMLHRLVRDGAVRVVCDAASIFHAGAQNAAVGPKLLGEGARAGRLRRHARQRKGSVVEGLERAING